MTDPVNTALSRGLEFLLARQSEVGFWADWQLPPGESLIWTTAYVGYRLSGLCGFHRNVAASAMQRAARWLIAREFSGGGWGYVEEAGPDADSTALAILFLTSQGLPVAERAWERLREFQRADGGFATFTSETSFGSWVISHPDVTATAVMALLTRSDCSDSSIARGLTYSREQMTASGLWNSFWWNSRLYGTEANLLLSRRADVQKDTRLTQTALHSVQSQNCFEDALLILSLLYIGGTADAPELNQTLTALLRDQLDDGSWPSAPILRLTDRNCREPWTHNYAGLLFADQNRIFTSATVIAALSAVSELTETTSVASARSRG